ncbi:MAG: NAD(+) diphosphatase [SAR324 cluster bacterium]|uniref:NAD(+) diphosphatase n=1 Tax=SAR324 cluster bacterium TaxID=2024889 RepID=A0A2A4SZW0_9DELT|nr:MAG: NAD(+) diphosphatase [SAR324 cluster bacterium]
MSFIPMVTPPVMQPETAWWFVFQNNKLLVEEKDGSVTIPQIRNLQEIGMTPIRKQYLGTLDGQHCYSVEVDEQMMPPKTMEFRGLRGLFESLDKDLWSIAGQAVQIVAWDQTHQFCGSCGQATESMEKERAKVCQPCNLTNYPRLSPAIIVAVLKDNKLLLGAPTRYEGEIYSVLAGFVEPGESLETCVAREVEEEVGIQVKNIQYFGSQPWPFPNSLMIGFTAEYAGGEINVDPTEILHADWYTVDKLPNFPGNASIARRLIDWFIEQHQ